MRTDYEFARYADSTLLKQDASEEQIRAHLERAKQCHFRTVAIGCTWIPLAKEVLAGSDVGIDAPIGYPNGYNTTESKVFETIDAFAKGATEADLLMDIAWFKSGRYSDLEEEIRRFVCACGDHVSKVIIETYFLNEAEIREATRIVKRAGATFVKTATGFTPKGATAEDIKVMLEEAGDSLLVKASGGIRSREFAEELLDLGAKRLGISNAHNLLSKT